MLTRSVVALVCGALAVTAFRGAEREYPREDDNALYRGYDGQETFRDSQWFAGADERLSGYDDEPPKHPPFPPKPHPPPHHGPHDPEVANKTIYQALKEDSRYVLCLHYLGITDLSSASLVCSSSSITQRRSPTF